MDESQNNQVLNQEQTIDSNQVQNLNQNPQVSINQILNQGQTIDSNQVQNLNQNLQVSTNQILNQGQTIDSNQVQSPIVSNENDQNEFIFCPKCGQKYYDGEFYRCPNCETKLPSLKTNNKPNGRPGVFKKIVSCVGLFTLFSGRGLSILSVADDFGKYSVIIFYILGICAILFMLKYEGNNLFLNILKNIFNFVGLLLGSFEVLVLAFFVIALGACGLF